MPPWRGTILERGVAVEGPSFSESVLRRRDCVDLLRAGGYLAGASPGESGLVKAGQTSLRREEFGFWVLGSNLALDLELRTLDLGAWTFPTQSDPVAPGRTSLGGWVPILRRLAGTLAPPGRLGSRFWRSVWLLDSGS